MQQLILIKDFLRRNEINTEVIECNTIRDKDGVALSSRNFLLSKKQRTLASKVFKLLYNNKNLLIKKKLSIKKTEIKILNMGIKKIDYIKVINTNKLIKPYKKNNIYRIFIAYYLGKVRLIDNI